MSTNTINMQALPVTCENKVMTSNSFVLKLVADTDSNKCSLQSIFPMMSSNKIPLKQVSIQKISEISQSICNSLFLRYFLFKTQPRLVNLGWPKWCFQIIFVLLSGLGLFTFILMGVNILFIPRNLFCNNYFDVFLCVSLYLLCNS